MSIRRSCMFAALSASVTALAAPALASSNASRATHTVVTSEGTHLVRTPATLEQARSAQPEAIAQAAAGTPGVLWTRNVTGAIIMTAGLSIPGGVATGSTLNAPLEVAMFALEGDGTPLWISPGNDYRTAAAANANVIAGVDQTGGRVIVRKWTSASATADWSFTILDATLANQRSVIVSDDGSTIAVLVNMAAGDARMLLFDSSSSTPIATYDTTDGGVPRNIVISTDGRFAAFRVTAWAYIYDRDTGSLRSSFNTGAGTNTITISDDGQYIAYGFTNVTVAQWTGAAYATLWSRTPPSSILRGCAISADGSTIATTWSSFGGSDPFVEMHDLGSSTPNWTYNYPGSGGTLQDIPSSIDLTADGGFLGVSSWGNLENSSPQIHLFERASSTPLIAVVTPGSMFDVNVAETAGGAVYVSAAGKHVHANVSGNGGDAYAIRHGDLSCPADFNGNGEVEFNDLVALLAAWGPCAGCPEDIDEDGTVGFADLVDLLSNWGPC